MDLDEHREECQRIVDELYNILVDENASTSLNALLIILSSLLCHSTPKEEWEDHLEHINTFIKSQMDDHREMEEHSDEESDDNINIKSIN